MRINRDARLLEFLDDDPRYDKAFERYEVACSEATFVLSKLADALGATSAPRPSAELRLEGVIFSRNAEGSEYNDVVEVMSGGVVEGASASQYP